MSDGLDAREAAVLAALFDASADRAELTPDERTEVEELEEILGAARDLTAGTPDWSAIREGALVGRVLAKTTREDLSWRGDLALVTSFVRDRLAASPVLKLVAASLLVHLAALPVLGWYVLREPSVQPQITFDVPFETADSAFLAESEEEGEASTDPEERLAERIENARRRARYVLTRSSDPIVLDPAQEPLEIRLLALRTLLARGGWENWLDDGERFERADRLQRVLWIELLLDRNVVSGLRSPLLAPGLDGLARVERAVTKGEAAPDAVAELEALVLRRARAYGLWEPGIGFDPRSAVQPFGPDWCAQVERALDERGLGGQRVLDLVLARCKS